MKKLNRSLRLIATVALTLGTVASHAATDYLERWRPQFHFTPATNWMNDPNGMVYYDGEYHLFYQYNPWGIKWGHMSWGHAVSPDLVHWEHLPVALHEENDVMIFSGSAVVDWKNTSGFGRDGRPPIVAIYTGHYTKKPLQNQHIAYSNDRGRTWTRYAGNPVLDIGAADFRDPKVMWHEESRRWVMAIAWPVERKIRFYASPDLKSWTHLSDFGPAGSTSGIWECPDLFPLKAGFRKRWVLVVNVGSGAPAGGSGCQYFVGRFDGTTFTLDPTFPKAEPEFVPAGQVLADFDGDDYSGWTATGTAFGTKPAGGRIGDQQNVDGFRGRGLVNSFAGGDKSEGTLRSPEFTVTGDYLSFLIGGGNHAGKTCMNLLADGKVVRTATGNAAERLAWKSWDVREWRGKRATLEIVDRHTGGWGHINVDQILLADTAARRATQPALWADYAPDFYAAVSWSDVPRSDGRRLWLGWMSNWQYANDVPTTPWRSAMSIPRALELRRTSDGIRMFQSPVKELQRLRGTRQAFRGGNVAEANAWIASQGIEGNQLEIRLVLASATSGIQGIKVLKGKNEETVIGVNRDRPDVFIDRRRSGEAGFHGGFAGVHAAPLNAKAGKVELQIFVDTSSVEVFVNRGEHSLTALTLPSQESRGLEFFAMGSAADARVSSVEIWPLQSSWKTRRQR